MKQEILTQFPWPWIPILGLIIFFTFFVGLLVRVSLRSRQHIFQSAEILPLEDGVKHE